MIYKECPKVCRGEIFYADLGENIGSEQNGVRPVLIIQNDVGNEHGPTTIVAGITSSRTVEKVKKELQIRTYRAKGCWYWSLPKLDN